MIELYKKAAGFLVILVLIILNSGCAKITKCSYSIVVDAGSSGTRIMLYEEKENEFFQKLVIKSDQPLADMKDEPERSGDKVIGPLLDSLLQQSEQSGISISDQDKNKIIVNVLGTAGMRMLDPDVQKRIYLSIKTAITERNFNAGALRTISGSEEGLYAWIDANKTEGLLGKDNTKGIFEVGGASMQITFDSRQSDSKGGYKVTWGNKTYYLVSKSFLGFGANMAVRKMEAESEKDACFPKEYKKSSGFIFNKCEENYNHILENNAELTDFKEQLSETESAGSMKFIGLGAALYHSLKFFDALNPEKAILKANIKNYCSNLKAYMDQNPSKDKYEPEKKCAVGTYIYTLVYDSLRLKDQSIIAADKIRGKKINWATGFLLMQSHSLAGI